MKKTRLTTYYLVLGLILFPFGLLLLFGQSSVVRIVSYIMPGAQTIEIFGLIIQFLGEGLICYGIVNAISNRVAASDELSRQVLFAGVSRNMQEQVASVSRNMAEQIATLNAKLDQIQQANAFQRLPHTPADCKFCGAKIAQSRFCPACGKAQN